MERIRADGVMTVTGRPTPPAPEPPAFCYTIADLTERMIEWYEMSDLRPTYDGLGYLGYHNAARRTSRP